MDKDKDIEPTANNAPWYCQSSSIAAAILIILLALIIYLPAVNGPFVLDDEINIVRNARLHDFANFWPPTGSRYLAHLTFALNYAAGGLKTTGYHLVNIVLHILSALTLYGLVRGLFSSTAIADSDKNSSEKNNANGHYIALITALIFTAHPLNTQAVIYITQRFTGLAALFYLLSLYLYIKWRNHKQGGLLFYVLSILSAIAASKTKEISFTLPFVILLTEYVFFTRQDKWISGKRLYTLIPYAIVLLIIPLSILGPELGLWSGVSVVDNGLTRAQQIADLRELSSYSYLMTQFTVVPKYIQLFFLPISQNLDYDYPLYHSFFNIKVIAGFFLLLVIFVSAILAARSAKRGRRPLLLLASAGVLWFFITLSIESTVIPIHDVIFEHRMYLPGAGLGLGVAVLIVHILRGRQRAFSGKAVLVAALIIITPLTALALHRSLLWRDGVKLYEDIARQSPEKARARNNLGAMYLKKGKLNKAMAEFRKAVAINPLFVVPYENVAKVYIRQGRFKEAAEQYKKILKKGSERAIFYFNIGLALDKAGETDEAIYYYRKFVELAPADLRNVREKVLYRIGQLSQGQR